MSFIYNECFKLGSGAYLTECISGDLLSFDDDRKARVLMNGEKILLEELAWCETENMTNSQLFDVCDSTTKHAVEIISGILASALSKLGFTGNPDDLFNADAESALPYYLVTLKLQIGEIEKTAKHLVQAINEEVATQAAFEHECHDEPVFDGDVCWDMNQEMAYSCQGIEPVPFHLAMILRKLL